MKIYQKKNIKMFSFQWAKKLDFQTGLDALAVTTSCLRQAASQNKGDSKGVAMARKLLFFFF